MSEIQILPDLLELRSCFQNQGFDIRFIGGCVRDSLCGIAPNDIDLATDATPEEQEAIYKSAKISHHATGLQHGTWTIVMNCQTYEVTTLRTDAECDGRHATVSWTRDWELDLARRDFTINAMCMDFDGDLLDPFGGKTDLIDGRIRFVGNSIARMTEDYLRILRFFRFLGRYGNYYDIRIHDAIDKCAPGLEKISRERVWSEMSKIISQSPKMLRYILDTDIPKYIDLPVTGNIEDAIEAQEFTQEPASLMAVYLDDEDTIRQLALVWKWSKDEKKQALFVALNKDMTAEQAKEKLALEVPKHLVLEALRAQLKPVLAEEINDWNIPIFPVNGDDLKELGFQGVTVGSILRNLKKKWCDSNFKMNKESLLEIL